MVKRRLISPEFARTWARTQTEMEVTENIQCPYCGQAEQVIRQLLEAHGDIRYVWRHLPLNDVHPRAQLAAEASEAAHAQGKFWDMYDTLLAHQDELTPRDLGNYAEQLGLDRLVDGMGDGVLIKAVERAGV